jgi:hypothetical protein
MLAPRFSTTTKDNPQVCHGDQRTQSKSKLSISGGDDSWDWAKMAACPKPTQQGVRQLKGLLKELDELEAAFAKIEDDLGLSHGADMSWGVRIDRIEAAKAIRGL